MTSETNHALAQGLQIAPLTLLALADGAQRWVSAKEVLDQAIRELDELKRFEVRLRAEQAELRRPQAARGIETTEAVHALKAKRFTQLEVAVLSIFLARPSGAT